MKTPNDPFRDYVRRLRQVDACALSDALDLLGLAGCVTGLPRRSGAGRLAGRVVTLKVGVGERPPGPVRHLGCNAIAAAGPDEVIVVEQRSGVEAGCWGGLLTLSAKLRGVGGVVADGPLRDIDEAVGYEFPVFSRSLTCRTARGRVVELGTNILVSIGGVDVMPGDYVLADGSGVVFVTQADIERVLAAAESIAGTEGAMARSLMAGLPISEVMAGNYEQMLGHS